MTDLSVAKEFVGKHCDRFYRWKAEYASNHDVYECEISNNWYHLDDLATPTCGDYEDYRIHVDYLYELPDGETCAGPRYEDDFDELLAEHGGEEDDDESDTEPEEFPCAPVITEVQVAA